EEGLERGDLKFELSGFKLRGTFALVRTSGRGNGKKLEVGEGQQTEWLLIKKQDTFATDEDIVQKDPRGVLSGLTGEENFNKAALVTELTELVAEAPQRTVAAQSLTPMLCAMDGG